jgi:hypothetical protein
MGRHALRDDERKSATIGVSVSTADRERYHAAAAERGFRLADMIRLALDEYISRHKPSTHVGR